MIEYLRVSILAKVITQRLYQFAYIKIYDPSCKLKHLNLIKLKESKSKRMRTFANINNYLQLLSPACQQFKDVNNSKNCDVWKMKDAK